MEQKLKRKGIGESACGSKKPRLEGAIQVKINPLYQSTDLQEKIRDAWRNKEMLNDESSGVTVYSQPFQLCVLPGLVSSPECDFLQQLQDELLRLKFLEKNNDLYQFRQGHGIDIEEDDLSRNMTFYTTLQILSDVAMTLHNASLRNSSSIKLRALAAVVKQVVTDACSFSEDLKRFKSPCIKAFRNLLCSECLPWLRHVTGIELNTTIDISCSKYEFTDNLLCHDDELEGRRIAFIFYLVPEWSAEDGGMLDLFDVDGFGQPNQIVQSISPAWNNFVFFEVTTTSFHQVSEVLSPSKTRLSISGWFHGPTACRPAPLVEPTPAMSLPGPADLSCLLDWVNPYYLDIGTQSHIHFQFEKDSQIELVDFLLAEKYEMLSEELRSPQCKWIVKGPPNKRHIHVADKQSLPPITTAFLEFVHSEPFCRLLSHLTGLDLAENVIRHSLDQGGGERGGPCSLGEAESDASIEITSSSGETKQGDVRVSTGERGSRKGGDGEGKDAVMSLGEKSVQLFVSNGGNRPPAASDSDQNGWTGNTQSHTPIDHSATGLDHSPDHPATGLDRSPDLPATGLDHSPDHSATGLDHSPDRSAISVPAASPGPATGSTARISGELLYCQPGDYTLISDTDPSIGECALDVLLHFCCEGWSVDYGGMTVYVAKDEDEQLLSIAPLTNALSLVYRDQDSIGFLKYINHRSSEDSDSSFFSLSFSYWEDSGT